MPENREDKFDHIVGDDIRSTRECRADAGSIQKANARSRTCSQVERWPIASLPHDMIDIRDDLLIDRDIATSRLNPADCGRVEQSVDLRFGRLLYKFAATMKSQDIVFVSGGRVFDDELEQK